MRCTLPQETNEIISHNTIFKGKARSLLCAAEERAFFPARGVCPSSYSNTPPPLSAKNDGISLLHQNRTSFQQANVPTQPADAERPEYQHQACTTMQPKARKRTKKGGRQFPKEKERESAREQGWLAGDCKTIYASSLLATARVTKRNAGLQHHHHHFRTAHGKGQTLPSARLLPYG